MNVYQRYKNKGDLTYYGRFTAPDPDKPGTRKRFLRNLGTCSQAEAMTQLRKIVKSMEEGRFEVVELTKLRHEKQTTIAELFKQYRRGARNIKVSTVELNILALRKMVRRVHFPEMAEELDTKHGRAAAAAKIDAMPLSVLDGKLVRDWKQTVHDKEEQEFADAKKALLQRPLEADARQHALETLAKERAGRAQQINRTSNSTLRQARSLFAGELRDTYEDAELTLPAGLRDFCDRPGFDNTGKTDYWPPADTIITTTFADLEKHATTDRNHYLAVWLALGFGLRKEEIASVRNSWFIERDGIVFLSGDKIAKNGTVVDVRVQLGAWAHIKPHLRGDPEAYVLEGHATERTETVFRRVGIWMRSLGWETQKAIHEFRAFAGSKIAEAEDGDLRAAQAFLRHRSYATTEKFYMRYMRIKMKEVKLVLPSVAAIPFTPVVLSAEA